MQKNDLVLREKRACTDPTHKTENLLFKIAIGLVIAITFNTFTSAFLLFSVYSQTRVQPQTRILKDDLSYRAGEVAPTATTKRVVKVPTASFAKAIETKLGNTLSQGVSIEEGAVEVGEIIQGMNVVLSALDNVQNIQEIDLRNYQEVSLLEREIRNAVSTLAAMMSACDRGEASCPFQSSEYLSTWKPHLEKLSTLLTRLADTLKNALADQKITEEEALALLDAGKTVYEELKDVRIDAQTVFTSKLSNLTKTIQSRVSMQLTEKYLGDAREEFELVIESEGTGHKAAELLKDAFISYADNLDRAIIAYRNTSAYQEIDSKLSQIQTNLSLLEEEITFTEWVPGTYSAAGDLLNLLSSEELASLMRNLNSTLANPVSNPNIYGVVAMLFTIDYGISPEAVDEPWFGLWSSLASEALLISGSIPVLTAISELQSCVLTNADLDGDQIVSKTEWEQCAASETCVPNITGCMQTKLQELLQILQTPQNIGKISQCLVDSIKENIVQCLITPSSCADKILSSYQTCMAS